MNNVAATFFWFGVSAGFLAGWFSYIGLNWAEKKLTAYVTSRASPDLDYDKDTGAVSVKPEALRRRVLGSSECTCYECSDLQRRMTTMITCATCGNKRCPHGTDHRHACTNSNEPNQPGSRYNQF